MRKIVIVVTVCAFFATFPSQAAAPNISDITPIPLLSGVNRIPAFATDGREAMVVLGWRENGNAHSYDLGLVLIPGGNGGPWNVVLIESMGDNKRSDVITDVPHTGDDMVKAFRFARGKVNGKPATLLLTATRDQELSIPEPSRVTFDVYRLEHEPDVGTTPDHFSLIVRDRSEGNFCNADMALSRRFNLPLRLSYQGARTPDGC
jgi:hypothetical protein